MLVDMAKSKEYGFALPAILGILALTSLTCATLWRMQWVNQQQLNVQARLIRNQEIAKGVFPLVLQDILGTNRSTSATTDSSTDLRHFAGTDAQTHAFFPTNVQEREKLQLRLGAAMCLAGICAPKTLNNLNAEQWGSLLGQSQAVNLTDLPSSEVAAFYWVEIWLDAGATEPVSSSVLAGGKSAFIYRITVLVKEAASSELAAPSKPLPNVQVMQAIWSRASDKDQIGQWHSQKLLL